MKTLDTEGGVTIMDLPLVVKEAFERAQRPLLPHAQGPIGLFVRYLRRKPERGLAVIYSVDELQTAAHRRGSDPTRAVSLTIGEEALDGAEIRFSVDQARQAAVEVQPSGVLRVKELGMSVQAFPADDSLPALAASCDTTAGSLLFRALEAAAQRKVEDAGWQLVSAVAEPVRYKPANRCVIRYRLGLERADKDGALLHRDLTLFGKVYAEAEQAERLEAMQQALYDEQANQDGTLPPLLPRPLGTLKELGLLLNEAVEAGAGETLRTGTRALQPQIVKGRGGEATGVVTPDEELRLAAVALARLHTSGVRPAEGSPRTGAKEGKRACERAALIASRNMEGQGEEAKRLARELSTRLEALQPDAYRPAHGGFKASQLLYHSHQVSVVDFDGFCLADSALDVGYFLAYLRPSGLWYRGGGMREWFEQAKEVFVTTYRQAMVERGIAQGVIDGIVERSRLYEAALIFKIATRRVNRLNSPRSKELAAMLSEITTCL